MPRANHATESAQHKIASLTSNVASLKATIRSLLLEVEGSLGQSPAKFRPQFDYFHQSLSDSFQALNRKRPEMPRKYETTEEKTLRSLESELGFEK